jgi:hypothetical protein
MCKSHSEPQPGETSFRRGDFCYLKKITHCHSISRTVSLFLSRITSKPRPCARRGDGKKPDVPSLLPSCAAPWPARRRQAVPLVAPSPLVLPHQLSRLAAPFLLVLQHQPWPVVLRTSSPISGWCRSYVLPSLTLVYSSLTHGNNVLRFFLSVMCLFSTCSVLLKIVTSKLGYACVQIVNTIE